MAKGKLKNLFKKKEGGTVIGNLLRKAGDTLTGGAYSALLPKPTAEDVKKQAEKLGIEVSPKQLAPTQTAPVQTFASTDDTANTPITKKPWFLPAVGIAVLAVIGIVVKVFTKKKK